jgi:hypothetical protein
MLYLDKRKKHGKTVDGMSGSNRDTFGADSDYERGMVSTDV